MSKRDNLDPRGYFIFALRAINWLFLKDPPRRSDQ